MTDLHANVLELEQDPRCEGLTPDPSIEEFRIVCDPSQPEGVRRAAFASMLHRERGWWGSGSLRRYTTTTARLCARNSLRRHNVSIDLLDWEGIADDSLLILYNRGHRIAQSPRNWLHGVIRNLVVTESRRILQHLQAPPEMLLSGGRGEETPESVDPARSNALRSAIRDLPRALRRFAALHFLQGLSRKETQTALATTAANIRVCHKRALERLRAALEDRSPE
jgi:DNA-directed RNA polymerase specialized sigma24 family protein